MLGKIGGGMRTKGTHIGLRLCCPMVLLPLEGVGLGRLVTVTTNVVVTVTGGGDAGRGEETPEGGGAV